MAILVDTGPLYALCDQDDQYHGLVKRFVAEVHETLIVPGPVVPEVCYLLLEHLGTDAELHFLRALASQELLLEHPTSKDLKRSSSHPYGLCPSGRISSLALFWVCCGDVPESHGGGGALPSGYSDSIGGHTLSTRSVKRSPINRSVIVPLK